MDEMPERNLYQILGCDRKASQAEIKKAYRRASKAAHPDHGGDANEMRLVNRAYEVLSDPDNRAFYDQFGEERKSDAEKEATALIKQFFEFYLDSGKDFSRDLIGFARQTIGMQAEQEKNVLLKKQLHRIWLLKQRNRIKGTSILEDLLNDRIHSAEQQIAMLEMKQSACAKALEMLNDMKDGGTWNETGALDLAIGEFITLRRAFR